MSADDKRLAIEQLQKGIIQHRGGQLGLAQSHYQRAAKLDPANASTWHLLGVCALQGGNLPLASKHLRACIKLSPGFAEAHNNLGVTLRRMGQHEESVAAFLGALNARERYVEAAYNLGLAYEATGRLDEAEKIYRQGLSWRTGDPNIALALGNLMRHFGRFDEALPLLQLARGAMTDNPQANGSFATLLVELGRGHEAIAYAQAAISLQPDRAAWWSALGIAERLRHNIEGAVPALRKAAELAPDDTEIAAELGLTLAESGAIDESRTMLARVGPETRHGERLRWARLLSLPSVYRDEAQVDAERARFAQGLDELDATLQLDTAAQRQRAYEAICGVAMFRLHYQDRDNTALQARFGDLVQRVLAACAPQLLQPCVWHARAHCGRLRVGIVSSHLMQHTVSRYFRELICGLDPARFDVRVWYGGEVRDASTQRIAQRAAAFEQVHEDALAVAARIRAAELDVLIYAETGMNPRHHVLGALRLAPVQCVLYGHPATSGLANMDYFVSGIALEPPNAQRHYRERLVQLPGLGACPQAPPPAGDGTWLDAYAQDTPLALCLQNHLKLAPAFDKVLAEVAARSGARIGFFARASGLAGLFRTRIEAAFRAHGLDPARSLAFLPAQDYSNYLGAIARATLIMDSPGFSGGATSLDAFGGGAPVLVWQGAMARGRQTSGMLAMMGVDGLVAADADDYAEKAVVLLADGARRAALRAQIGERSRMLFEHKPVVEAFSQFLDSVV